jgi:ATP-dependent DNA ligase
MSSLCLLQRLQELVTEVTGTNSSNEKLERIREFEDIKDFIGLLMDPLQTTGVTSVKVLAHEKNIKKKSQKTPKKRTKPAKGPAAKRLKTSTPTSEVEASDDNLEVKEVDTFLTNDIPLMLQRLYDREYSGHQAYEAVIYAMEAYPEHRDLVLCIANKNLKLRMDVKQINKAFPNLIKVFSVALAQDLQKARKSFDKSLAAKEEWVMSRKFDGVRSLVLFNGKKAKSYSRNGKEFPALQRLNDLLEKHAPLGQKFVLDGEVCSVDEKGNENFTDAVSQVKRKSVVMENFKYYVFDVLTMDEFESGTSTRILSERLGDAETLFETMFPDGEIREFHLVDQTFYTDEAFEELASTASDLNWEGLMLRKDTVYKGKRSNDILKHKKFFIEEYEVLDTENALQRIIDEETGLEKEEVLLKSVIIDHKGGQVNVGSGFTRDQRRLYKQHPEQIIGRTITVQYFEECQSSNASNLSLRFPTVKKIWGPEGRDV